MNVTRLPIGRPVSAQERIRRQYHSLIGVNPLQTTWLERGTVSGRVALLLRSAEIQPLFEDLSDWASCSNHPLSSPGAFMLQGGFWGFGAHSVHDAAHSVHDATKCFRPLFVVWVSDDTRCGQRHTDDAVGRLGRMPARYKCFRPLLACAPACAPGRSRAHRSIGR